MSARPSGERGAPPLLRMDGVRKTFPNGTVALAGFDLEVDAGSVHGLVGANGAGKSTLIKILSGALRADAGSIAWDGEPVSWDGPRDAQASGVATIYQHIPLAPTLSVIENVFLARGGWARRPAGLAEELDVLLARIGYDIDPETIVGTLPIGQRQMVAILQALAQGARMVVMDEPTASLAQGERETVFAAIRRLRDGGTAIIYVSHFLDEILDLTDRVTVLRDGRVVSDTATATLDEDALVRAILDRELTTVGERPAQAAVADAPVVLDVEHLTAPAGVSDVTFQVRVGEVLGIAGLLGSGRSELLHAIYGADPRARGTVRVDGREVARSTSAATAAGLALVPEDRAGQGLFGGFEIWRNVSVTDLPALSEAGIVPNRDLELSRAEEAIDALRIKAPGPDTTISELSGGNAQKVVFGKWLFAGAKVFLLDEPTAGIDVGSKRDIVELVRGLAARGAAVVVVDSEFEELLGVATRVLVMRRGRIVAEREAGATTEHELLQLASGRLEREIDHAA